MKKCELNITLTTSRTRPDLVPSLEKNDSATTGFHERRADVFGWVAKETIGQKGSRRRGGTSENDGRDESDNNEMMKRFVPITVSSALEESKKRIFKLNHKYKLAKKKQVKEILQIKKNTKNLLKGIRKEARRARTGDVNELANELSGLNKKSKK